MKTVHMSCPCCGQVLNKEGFSYRLEDLLNDPNWPKKWDLCSEWAKVLPLLLLKVERAKRKGWSPLGYIYFDKYHHNSGGSRCYIQRLIKKKEQE